MIGFLFVRPVVVGLKGDPLKIRIRRPDQAPDPGDRGPRIRCPKCAWEPGRGDRWMCSCLHSWNTFDTYAVCPACAREWAETQCLSCYAWSPHADWYVADER